MASAASARVVSAASSFGNKPHYASIAGAALHPQSGRDFCFADVLDVALGCAWSFVVTPNSGFDKSHQRPCPGVVIHQRGSFPMSATQFSKSMPAAAIGVGSRMLAGVGISARGQWEELRHAAALIGTALYTGVRPRYWVGTTRTAFA